MDALAHVKPFQVDSPRLLKIAAAMGLYLLIVIWPCFIWLRHWLADDASPGSPSALGAVLLVALLLAAYAFVVMKRLCLPRQ